MSTLVANFLTDAYAEANAQCADWIRVAPVLRKSETPPVCVWVGGYLC